MTIEIGTASDSLLFIFNTCEIFPPGICMIGVGDYESAEEGNLAIPGTVPHSASLNAPQ